MFECFLEVPEIAELHLEPALLPAILGFFVYTVGKVPPRQRQDPYSTHIAAAQVLAGVFQ